MKVKLDGKYITRSGRPVTIYAIGIEGSGDYSVHGAIRSSDGLWGLAAWRDDGKMFSDREMSCDLIEMTVQKWINFQGDFMVCCHNTEVEAKECAERNGYTTCVRPAEFVVKE